MISPRTILGLILLPALLFGPLPAAEPQPRTDTSGDALPDRAIARLGTTRLRVADSPTGLAYSPDGKLLAAVSYEGSVMVWSMPSGRKLQEFKVGTNTSAKLAFSKNGTYLAYSTGKESHIWDTKDGKELPRPAAGDWFSWDFVFAPDGKSIAGTMVGGKLRLWRLADAKELQAYDKVEGGYSLAFPELNRLLAVTRNGGSTEVWDAIAGKRLSATEAQSDSFPGPIISPNGKVFALVAGRVVSVHSVADGKELRRLTGHKEGIHSLAFSADSNSLAVGSRTVQVWDVTTGKERGSCETIPGGLPLVALSPDGKTLATGGRDAPHAVLLWDAATGRPQDRFPGHTGPIASLAFSPDGKQVATAAWRSAEAEVRLWEAATGQLLREFPAHPGGVTAVSFSPDGKCLATSGETHDRKVKVWDVATGRELRTFTGHEAKVEALAFSPDGRRLASGDSCNKGPSEGRVRVWDLEAGRQVALLSLPKGAIFSLTFERGGARLLVGAAGVHRYDMSSAERVGEPLLPEEQVWSLTLSPDGKILLAASGSHPARLWEVATRREIFDIKANWCGRAAFSPDGRFIALGTDTGVRLIDRADGRVCLTPPGTRGIVEALAFSPDGRALAGAAAGDTSALIWDVADLARRPLPAAEKAEAAALDRWYEALKDADPAVADRAAWEFIARPEQAVNRLKGSLQPVKESETKRVARLIADLDDDAFEARERASGELEMIGAAAEEAMRAALRNKPSAEQRRRLEEVLGRLKAGSPGGEPLRVTRAVAVLEQIGTPQAREVLQGLARGAPDAALTLDARSALDRLDKRKGPRRGE